MIRTRFAPSPTGYLHIGGARTALFSWLYAKKHGGQFILRVEDTDRERSTQEAVDAIFAGMEWLGLTAEEGPFYQTQRFGRYKEVMQQLLDDGKAYHCYCSKERLEQLREDQMAAGSKPRYDRCCLNREGAPPEGVDPVVRFLNPTEGSVVVDDQIKGAVVFDNAELDDLIIARSDGSPTYNFCVVVDDLDMQVTHVVRGDDHLNNTPRQINILTALGANPPSYAHVPMILGDDGQKLSKRHGAVGVMQYRDDGFLPEAVLNYLVRLGWSHGDQEIFSVDEMIELFDLADVNKSASAFNTEKLCWLNQHYMKESDPQRLANLLEPHLQKLGIDPASGPDLVDVVEAQRERAQTLVEMAEISEFIYRDFSEYDEKAAKKNLRPVAADPLVQVKQALQSLEDWAPEALHQVIIDVSEAMGVKMGKVAQPLRVAVVGRAASPGIDVTLFLVGKEACLRRIDQALAFIDQRAAVS